MLAQRGNLDSRRQELEAVRNERRQVLAKLNTDMQARDQKLQARQQDQADLTKVLKTIEETLARQAREAEEARKKALLAQQQAEEQRRQQQALAANEEEAPKKPAPPSAPSSPAMAQATAALFLPPAENFPGRSMVDCWHASAMHAVAMTGPSGTV